MAHVMEVEDEYRGLGDAEVASLQATQGYNERPSEKKRTLIDIAVETMREPTFALLLLGALLYIVIGDMEGAALMFVFVAVVIGISVYQEIKVERALEALQDLSSPRARVIRNGKQMVVPGRDVVRGDIIILSEGDRVPADVVILSCSNLMVDESLLTGEAVPVRKSSWDGKTKVERPGGDCEGFAFSSPPRPGGEDLPFAYSSTLVSQGHAVVRVIAIGAATEVGKIGKALEKIKPETTELQKETNGIVKLYSAVGAVACIAVVAILGFVHGRWMDGFVSGLSLAMALVPYEFLVVLAGFLALGAWRMSKHNVLTRRMNAIQNLGSSTVLCSDKTGTLTENRMTLEKIRTRGKTYALKEGELADAAHETLEYAVLASQKEPFDPMERAIKDSGTAKLSGTEHLHADWELVREYTLSRNLLALSHVWRAPNGKEYLIAAKGAPEAIFDLCHLKKGETEKLMDEVTALSGDGYRVLGVAHGHFTSKNLPESQHDFEFEFEGLIALDDPVRPEVAGAVRECYEAGIRVIMITGDYPGTAKVVAKKAGFAACDDIITGAELDSMDEARLRERIKSVSVFARVVPEQKLRIVEALKANGEIVVMTGDGVNDAPALKAAAVGIAMGGRGTEVARESSSLVLTDDNFTSIVQAVRMGRRIYDNIKKAMGYIISVHMPIAGISLMPVIFGWPIALYPVHIAFLELIIDPVCSVVFEAESEEKNIMRRKPRRHNEPLFDRATLIMSTVRGVVLLAIIAFVYSSALSAGQSEQAARGITFATLVLGNLALVLSSRSQTQSVVGTLVNKNDALLIVIVSTLACLALVLYVPFLQELFQIAAPSGQGLATAAGGAFAAIVAFEALKVIGKVGAKAPVRAEW